MNGRRKYLVLYALEIRRPSEKAPLADTAGRRAVIASVCRAWLSSTPRLLQSKYLEAIPDIQL